MAVHNIEEIIRKAVTDTEFRERLFSNSDEVFDEYGLDDDERAAFKDLSEDALTRGFDWAEAGELEERISRGGYQ